MKSTYQQKSAEHAQELRPAIAVAEIEVGMGWRCIETDRIREEEEKVRALYAETRKW